MSATGMTLQWLRGYGLETQHPARSMPSDSCTLADVLTDDAHGSHAAQDVPPLEAHLRLSPQDQAQAALCRITSQWVHGYRQWYLHNDSHQLRCSVGSALVAPGAQVPLEDGDLIEFGLFVVEFHRSADVPAPATTTISDAKDADATVDADADIDPYFRLTDLAAPIHSTALLPPADRVHQPASDISSSLDPRSDPTSANLTHQPDTPAATTSPVASDNPLDQLHQRYLRVIKDPTAAVYTDAFVEHSAAGADTRHAWDEVLENGKNKDMPLHDVVTPQPSIERISDGLDTLLGSDLMSEPTYDNVLLLFAPPQTDEALADPLGLAHRLPSLTRQEHHNIAIGSSFDMPTQESPPS